MTTETYLKNLTFLITLRINTPLFHDLFKKGNEMYNLRDQKPFKEEIQKRNYIHHAPIHRLARKWNSLKKKLRDSLINVNCRDKTILKSEILRHF